MHTTPTTFIKPRKAAGIPIVNPETRSFVPPPALAVPGAASARDVDTQQLVDKQVARKGGDRDASSEPVSPATTGQKGSDKNGFDNRFDSGFDVYATPFVPDVLRAINRSPAYTTVNTPMLKCLNLVHYGLRVLGAPHLLSSVPAPDQTSPISVALYPTTYELYFRFHLANEGSAQRKENATYSLYSHQVSVVFDKATKAATCSLLVPGLPEHCPYVEEDDEVILRQVRTDHLGRVQRTHPNGPWNGIEYRGQISAVLRAKEKLVVQVNGLTHQTAEPQGWNIVQDESRGFITSLRFNVQFPVPEDRHQPQKDVLPHFQAALRQARDRTYEQVDSFDDHSPASDEFHYWVQSMLFPTEADCDAQFNLPSGHFEQHYIDNALNHEQKTAVENICLQNYGTVPYIISGPPGTGKTKTLIETALQLLKNVEQVSHILVCAPSEPATDTLAERLRHHLQPHELLRLNRPSRSFNEVPDALLPYCNIDNNMFAFPEFEQLMRFRVVVTSCRDACLLMYSRMTNADLYDAEYGLSARIHPFRTRKFEEVGLHWTALLLDEAAQATEPEALLPLHVIAPPLTSPKLTFTPLFVMAGDQCQLGPKTSMPQTPLRRSLFARLIARSVYANHPLARGRAGEAPPPLTPAMLPILRPPFTNLIRNYRSHPAILAMPSKLFYFDTLLAEALRPVLTLGMWDGWTGKRWPILYHNNKSPDDLERDGGGWFNDGEATLALQYATRLSTHLGGRQKEICIMSPFKAQVRRLRKLARSPTFQLFDVNIGPTEAFQGLEHGVVILCVTRSRQRFVEKDKELNWGIIGQPNTMNVALTRAKYGLIILGDQDVLWDDPHWRAVLQFYYRSGSVVNPQVTEDMKDPKPDDFTNWEKDSMVAQWEFEGSHSGASAK
jgi:putative helicase MOV10L1/helicase MOV-10